MVVPRQRNGGNTLPAVPERDAAPQRGAVPVQPGTCTGPDCSRPPAPRQGETGRPRVYCSDECARLAKSTRAAARRAAARGPDERAADRSRDRTRFGTLLAEAAKQNHLTLDQLSTRLAEEYRVHISPSTLSTWMNGRHPRRVPDDRQRIEALEAILKLHAGELHFELERDRTDRHRGLVPLSPRSPNGEEDPVRDLRDEMVKIGGSDAYTVTAAEDRVLIGDDLKEYLRTCRLTVKALDRYTDCYRLVWTPDDGEATSVIVAKDGCRRGRELSGASGLSGVELLFDHRLDKESAYSFVYQEQVQHSGEPQCWVRRGVGHSAVDLITITVRFAMLPTAVWACRWDERGVAPIDLEPVPLIGDTATLERPHPAPGLHGLTWSW